jgi:hypothetical protein
MGSPTIPQDYYLRFPDGIGVDTHLDGNLNTNLGGTLTLAGTVATNNTAKLTGDPAQPIATLLIGDPNKPVATESKIELVNLPKFTLQDIKDMMKVRVRIPNYSQVCFKLLGQEIFSICINGEGQVITEPYVPNAAERCEVECCEPDTRPFPERSTNTDTGVPAEPVN